MSENYRAKTAETAVHMAKALRRAIAVAVDDVDEPEPMLRRVLDAAAAQGHAITTADVKRGERVMIVTVGKGQVRIIAKGQP